MYQQDVKGKKLSGIAGIALIILIVLSITAAGLLERILYALTGNAVGAVVVWGMIAVEILCLLRFSVREYRYTLTDDRLFIESRYGDSVRIIHEIPLASVVALGPQEEIFEKYGNAQAYDRVYTRGYSVSESALVYLKDGENKLLSFQPDEKMCAMILEYVEGRS